MKQTLILLIILIVQTGYSQNYIQYNSLICEAENGIVESNYRKGLEKYLGAFKIVKIPFAVDYYNAALCAAKLKNDSIALILIEKLLEKGIALRKLKSKSFKYLYKTNSWNVLKTKEKKYKKELLLKQNIELREKLEKLLHNDQKIRTKKYGYPMSDTIASVDSLNMIEMKIILDKYGYPDENLIGIKNPQYLKSKKEEKIKSP